ncbi:type II secretion system protein [Limnohabitans sp.]|uniref:pilus assembly FimT family protein n=1 Tax=Limnohabitans sp. TaxID=1907725 RepID=UPI00286F31DF|nr:type II secretion system protein [Limnohabitans sp.]
MQRQRGLTLLELLVVMAIIGVCLLGVSLSLRDNQQTQLEREAQRLVAVLEAARAQSRTSGIPLVWEAKPEGFVIRTPRPLSAVPVPVSAIIDTRAPFAPRHQAWLTVGTQATVLRNTITASSSSQINLVVLGPEPILAPTRISLRLPATRSNAASTLHIGTDGLQPFHVEP